MIDEAIGKIIGMAMAYGVSAMGLFLAYANYRKRTLKAETVMTPRAWAVVVVILVAICGGVVVVAQLAQPPAAAPEEAVVEAPAPAAVAAAPTASADAGERDRWPLVGILAPALIFLFATWVTGALYRHFAHHGHGPAEPDPEGSGP